MISNNQVQKIFFIGIIIGLALIILGWVMTPTESLTGVLAACIVLVIYGLIVWRTFEKTDPIIISNAKIFGLIAGAIFTSEIILEYILLPINNTIFGLVEFGSVFLLYFLAGANTGYQTTSIRNGVLAAIWTSLVATLIWSIVTLSMFYLFRGTPQQTQVFQAEGNYADFAQSGLTDFNTFITEDFMGAIFFHSLLGPGLASILGVAGGMLGMTIARVRSPLQATTKQP